VQNFIVLGYIPGTHVQITFYTWLVVFATFCLLAFVWLYNETVRAWLVSRELKAYFRHLPLSDLAL
jgi:hypothetical protein